MPDALQYGALGVLSLVVLIVLQFAFKHIARSSDFVEGLASESIAALKEANETGAKTQRRVAEELHGLGTSVAKTQLEMERAMRLMANDLEKQANTQDIASQSVKEAMKTVGATWELERKERERSRRQHDRILDNQEEMLQKLDPPAND